MGLDGRWDLGKGIEKVGSFQNDERLSAYDMAIYDCQCASA